MWTKGLTVSDTTNQGTKADPELSPRLRKRWLGYAAAAAGAACITPAAQASIVYNNHQYTVPVNSSLSLPIGDFSTGHNFYCIDVSSAGQECVGWFRGNAAGGGNFAKSASRSFMVGAVGKGALIGASRKFGTGLFVDSLSGPFGTNTHFRGGEGLIGVEIGLGGGQYDFGWANVSLFVSCVAGSAFCNPGPNYGFGIHINSYAYDTIPNQPIRAGQTTPEPGTLGLLALGSLGLGLWRKRKANSVGDTAA